MLHWFFGIPGSGKSHLARRFSQMTGMPHYEGDDFHTEDDRRAVANGTFTLQRRHAQLERINAVVPDRDTVDAVITHPLPDKVSRTLVRDVRSQAVQLVYIRAPLLLIKERLSNRTDHHFSADLLPAWIVRHWQEPEDEKCIVIENGLDSRLVEAQLVELCWHR